jgi:hypothetical protein
MRMEAAHMSMVRRCARLLPAGLRRTVWRYRFRRLPDRVYLEARILPWFAARGATHLLSVGCQDYGMTRHYEGLLDRAGVRLSTADIDPAAAAFGAAYHVTKGVAALLPGDCPRRVEGVLLNGVIGWGLDDPAEIDAGFTALAGLMRGDTPLVVGWDEERSADPAEQAACRAFFRRCAGPTGESRVTIADSTRFNGLTHVYDFFLRAPKPAVS